MLAVKTGCLACGGVLYTCDLAIGNNLFPFTGHSAKQITLNYINIKKALFPHDSDGVINFLHCIFSYCRCKVISLFSIEYQ